MRGKSDVEVCDVLGRALQLLPALPPTVIIDLAARIGRALAYHQRIYSALIIFMPVIH